MLGQEQNLEPVAHRRVAVDSTGQVVDELDDDLGQLVSGGCLAGEKESPRRHVKLGVLPQPIVEYHDAERVQQLPLVFMDALDLAIEDAIGVYRLAGCPLEPVGKLRLSLAFGLTEIVAQSLVTRQRLQFAQLTEVIYPAVAYGVGDRLRKRWVRHQ